MLQRWLKSALVIERVVLSVLVVAAYLVVFGTNAHGEAIETAKAGRKFLAGRVLLPDGTLRENAVVVISEGKVQRVGDPTDFAGEDIYRFGPDAVISPGMLDLFATPGIVGQTLEDTESVEPAIGAIQLLDPTHADFRMALEAGITSVMVTPTAANLVNGVAVTARTQAVDGKLSVLRDDGPLLLAFGEGVWRADRAPTSRAGAVEALRELLDTARAGETDARISAVLAGKLDAWIACTEKLDITTLSRLLGDDRHRLGVIHTKDLLKAVDLLRTVRPPVVVGPYSLDASRRELLGAAALSEAGIEVAFRSGFPTTNRHALRLTAALAVRHGMDSNAARRAITCGPATVAGVADVIGSIAAGKDADLVIFSNDPLRIDAQVLEVYIRGERVYVATGNGLTIAGARS